MSPYKCTLPLISTIAVSILFSASICNAGWLDGTVKDIGRIVDPTNKNSETRKAGRNVDPTNRKGYVGSRTRGVMNLLNPAAQACVKNGEITYNRNRTRARRLSNAHTHWLRKRFGNIVDRVVVHYDSLLNDGVTFKGEQLYLPSSAQTYGYNIYVSGKQLPDSTSQLLLLGHEFEHVRQYENAGKDLLEFCSRYMGNYLRNRSYMANPMERDAYDEDFNFAKWLAKQQRIIDQSKFGTWYYESPHPDNKRSGVNLPHFL